MNDHEKKHTAKTSHESIGESRRKRTSKNYLLALLEKKQYLEFITVILTIPFLITLLILNVNSVLHLKDSKQPTPTPQTVEKIYYKDQPNTGSSTVIQTVAPCKKAIGPISIISPNENDIVKDNPVSIEVSYPDTSYCDVVWSYRVNGGDWSSYDNKSIALYNPPQGNIKLELRVKSITGGTGKTLTRNFVYKGSTIVSPSNGTASSSAN